MEDENVLLREEEIQKLTNTMTTTNTSKSYVDSSINLNTLGSVGLGTTTPNQTLNYLTSTVTGGYNYAIDHYDMLTNDERINAILKSVNSLTDSVNTLKATARELISEMKVEKHERRTLGKNSE